MADDNDPWKRFRDREDDPDRLNEAPIPKKSLSIQPNAVQDETREMDIEDLIERAETLIERCNALYQMWRNGAEKRPPIEVKSQLDSTVRKILNHTKPTQSAKFKVGTLISRYRSYCERWERIVRQKETA